MAPAGRCLQGLLTLRGEVFDMLDQNTFMETIREVAEIIRTSDKPLSREEILRYFDTMDLNETQENMVLEYLLTPQTEENAEDVEKTPESVTEEFPESPVFQMYLDEIKELTVCSEAELEDLYEDLLEGDTESIRKISDSWMFKVLEMAKELSVAAEDFPDLVQEGNMGLFMKLSEICGTQEKMDVAQVLEASVFMVMKAYMEELGGEDNVENTMVGKATLVNEARKYLMEENGQEPTLLELENYTHMQGEELEDILNLIRKAEEK